MLCYWGEEVRAGFGLVRPEEVQRSSRGVFFCSPKTPIRQLAPGKSLVGFVRGEGALSLIRAPPAGRLKSLNLKDKIRLMSCGDTQAVLLTHGGRALWMDMSNNCSPIRELVNKNVIQVACGDQHCMALTHDGLLFTWGQNSSGQLGLGKGARSSDSPQLLKSLCGVPLALVTAGGEHSFALSLSGAVFSWGKNSAGQLGLGDREDRYVPACVKNLSLKKTVFISCGEEHTATLSKGGTVFMFGSGCHGQLGHNSFRDELQPRVLAELWGLNVSQVACGRNHTLALAGSAKTIYSFGCGEQGQLGNGQQTNQCVPLPVHLPPEANHSQAVKQIIAGGNLSFVLCSQQESDNHSFHPEIMTLDNDIIRRWLSDCDSNQWRKIKKEIKRAFSSAACLNGSFIKRSCDGHCQTSASFSGLDLQSWRNAVKQLAKKDKVLLEVKKIVENDLLPSLDSSPLGAEALRIYLILPKLLKVLSKLENETTLSNALASAVLKLNPSVLQVLENYWSELPDNFLIPVVKLFRKFSASFLSQRQYGRQDKSSDEVLQKSVQVLQMIYKTFSRGEIFKDQRKLTSRDFIIYEINNLLDILQCINTMWQDWFPEVVANKQYLEHTLKLLNSCPCIFDLEAKCKRLTLRPLEKVFRLVLRRNALLEDCFSQLRAADEDAMKGWLQVMYVEKLEQSDVNKRDFFYNIFNMLMMPESRMFMYNDTKTLIWFPAEASLQEEHYFLFGCLCGLVFYNNSVVNLPFPLALFKKLVNIQPSLEDLAEFSPVLGGSLQYTLDCSDEDVDSMDMSFTIVWDNKEVELYPDEPGKIVTSSNRRQFVDAYVDYALNKSVEQVSEEFKRGFFKVCDQDMVKLFQPEELRGVMVGTEEYEWDALKKNVTYENGFHARHPTIVSFWEVFDELSNKDKRAFLLFLTGFDRVPVLGMDQVKMRVRPLFNSTENHLPEALTCHALLELPIYQTKETLSTKLIEALHHKRGFWEE